MVQDSPKRRPRVDGADLRVLDESLAAARRPAPTHDSGWDADVNPGKYDPFLDVLGRRAVRDALTRLARVLLPIEEASAGAGIDGIEDARLRIAKAVPCERLPTPTCWRKTGCSMGWADPLASGYETWWQKALSEGYLHRRLQMVALLKELKRRARPDTSASSRKRNDRPFSESRDENAVEAVRQLGSEARLDQVMLRAGAKHRNQLLGHYKDGRPRCPEFLRRWEKLKAMKKQAKLQAMERHPRASQDRRRKGAPQVTRSTAETV